MARETGNITAVLANLFGRSSKTWFGLILVVILALVALLAPAIAPSPPSKMAPADRFMEPSLNYLFGTDQFGRDILSRVIYGARISLGVGVASVLAASSAGTVLGMIAGYFRGFLGTTIMRCVDVLMAFPAILLAVTLMAVLGSNLTNVILAIGIVYTPIFARLVNGVVLEVSENDYVLAARATGASSLRILVAHVFPNVRSIIVIQMTLSLSTAILAEAALSFLGLGTQPPSPSWGRMLSESRTFMEVAPWAAIFPGLAIMITVIAFNLLGDTLRDHWDPRRKL